MEPSNYDDMCMRKAVSLAMQAGQNQNLPIGAVISLHQQIIAEGKNTIWHPRLSLHRHAEMEALGEISSDLISKSSEMTLYTTLEPCLMCLGAILLYGIGRVVYGSADPYGGAIVNPVNLPPYFKDRFSITEWIGPAYTKECDILYQRIVQLEKLPGQKQNLPKS